MVPADAYTVAGDAVTFHSKSSPTVRVALHGHSLLAHIEGAGDSIRIQGAGILDKLNWMILGFGPEDRLARLVVELTDIKIPELDRVLRPLFEDANVPLRRTPPTRAK